MAWTSRPQKCACVSQPPAPDCELFADVARLPRFPLVPIWSRDNHPVPSMSRLLHRSHGRLCHVYCLRAFLQLQKSADIALSEYDSSSVLATAITASQSAMALHRRGLFAPHLFPCATFMCSNLLVLCPAGNSRWCCPTSSR